MCALAGSSSGLGESSGSMKNMPHTQRSLYPALERRGEEECGGRKRRCKTGGGEERRKPRGGSEKEREQVKRIFDQRGGGDEGLKVEGQGLKRDDVMCTSRTVSYN